MTKHLALVLLAACGSSGGGGNGTPDAPNQGPDAAKVFMDAPISVPQMITVSGTAAATDNNGSTPLAGVTVAFLKAADDSMLATATSGADGTYSMMVATSGGVVDGYVKATISTYADNYTYPTAPLAASATIDSAMVTSSNFGLLGGVTGQTASKGFVAAIVLDASGQPVTGAAVTSTPAPGAYAYSSGIIPSTSATATASDGQAYFINVPAGNLTVNATKSGITFRSHVVKGHPGALTTTTITP